MRLHLSLLPPLLGALLAVLLRCWPVLSGEQAFLQWDALFSALAVDHLQSALLLGADWRELGLGWPAGHGITHVDWMAVQALLGLPGRLLGVDPALGYTQGAVLGLGLSGLGLGLLARALLGPGLPAALAAFLGALSPWALAHAQHANLVYAAWVLLACVGAWVPGRWATVGGVLGIPLALHSGLYLGVQATVLAGVLGLTRAAFRRQWGGLAAWAGGTGLALLSAAPVLWLYRETEQRFGVQLGAEELLAGSWDPLLAWRPLAGSWAHAPLLERGPGATLLGGGHPGYGVACMALLGGLGVLGDHEERGRWAPVLLVGLCSALLALGPELVFGGRGLGVPGPYAVLAALPGTGALREPSRWIALTWLVAALLAVAGVCRLGAAGGRWRWALALGLIAWAESPRPASTPRDGMRPHEVYRALDGLPLEGALLETGLRTHAQGCGCEGAHTLRAAQFHGRPLLGGRYARKLEPLLALQHALEPFPAQGAAALAQAAGVTVVLQHPPWEGEALGWSCQVVEGHRLCLAPQRAERVLEAGGEGPAVGLRVPLEQLPSPVVAQCGDGPRQVLPTAGWEALAALRATQAPPAAVDLWLEGPCAAGLRASPSRWALLAEAPGDQPWLPPLPPRARTLAALYTWADTRRPEPSAGAPPLKRPESPP